MGSFLSFGVGCADNGPEHLPLGSPGERWLEPGAGGGGLIAALAVGAAADRHVAGPDLSGLSAASLEVGAACQVQHAGAVETGLR
jgi:hypothetical protein